MIYTLLMIVLPASAAGFKVKALVPVDTFSASVAIADFDHDGKLDLAVACYDSNATLSVLIGNGDGTFQPQVRYPVGSGPYGVAAGDLDSDGNTDLVVTNYNDGTVSVLLGTGDGRFQPQMVFSGSSEATVVALGDYNGDGNLDLATSGQGAAILLGNGDGTFQTAMFPTSRYANSVVTGDFNRDGTLDVAFGFTYGSSGKGYIQTLLGNGDGSFTPGMVSSLGSHSTPYSIASGDLNHDGKLDLAATTFSVGVEVLIGRGDGSFFSEVPYTTPYTTYSLAMVDLDRDGNLDLAVADFLDPAHANVLIGKGDGTFLPAVTYDAKGKNGEGIGVGDFNRDGSPYIVVTHLSSENVSILLNTGGTLVHSRSSLNPSQVGQSVTFTAQVEQSIPNTGVPTGTVTFKDGATTLGAAPLVSGTAKFSTSALGQGTHTIVVSYSGDANFNPNSAKGLVQVVSP
ncbi:MAG: VCBS repeat-containing protein [Acidobacteriales bacterium]|nr:VCBS repeat-containing protein [Terriglobales bacterium]